MAAKAAHYPLRGATLQKRIFLRRPLKVRAPAGLRLHDQESLYAPDIT